MGKSERCDSEWQARPFEGLFASDWNRAKDAPHPSTVPSPVVHDKLEAVNQKLPKPQVGDSILVVRHSYIDMILKGEKTVELRGIKHRSRTLWLGFGGVIRGRLHLGAPTLLNEQMYRAWRPQHRCHLVEKPYTNCWAHGLSNVLAVQPMVPYQQTQGPVGWDTYHPPGQRPGKKSELQIAAGEMESQKAAKQPKRKRTNLSPSASLSPSKHVHVPMRLVCNLDVRVCCMRSVCNLHVAS